MVISALSFIGRPRHRRGTVLPLVALTIVAQISFLALAIDLGMLAIAKTQVQNAADLAALTAVRTSNGDATTTYNKSAATTNAQNALTYNSILGKAIQSSQLTALLRLVRLQPDHAIVQRQFPGDKRHVEYRGRCHGHLEQLAWRVQQDLRVAIPPERHG